MRKCLLAMLIMILVILMLIMMLLNLNTGYADTDADLCIRIMYLCCNIEKNEPTNFGFKLLNDFLEVRGFSPDILTFSKERSYREY